MKGWLRHGVCGWKHWPYDEDEPGRLTPRRQLKALARPLGASLKHVKATMGPEHPALALIHNNLGAMYAYQEKWGQAEAAYKRALAFGQAHLGPAHPDTTRILKGYVRLLHATGRGEQAQRLIAEAQRKADRARAARRQSAKQGSAN